MGESDHCPWHYLCRQIVPFSVEKNMTSFERVHFRSTPLKLDSFFSGVLKFFCYQFFYSPNSSLGTSVVFLSYKPTEVRCAEWRFTCAALGLGKQKFAFLCRTAITRSSTYCKQLSGQTSMTWQLIYIELYIHWCKICDKPSISVKTEIKSLYLNRLGMWGNPWFLCFSIFMWKILLLGIT